MMTGVSTRECRKPQAEWVQSLAQLDFYTFFRKLLKQISFLYFPDRGCDPARHYLYWMSYMPDNFPKSLTAVYPILYNYSYLLAEGIITVIIISIPAVSKALTQIKRTALQ